MADERFQTEQALGEYRERAARAGVAVGHPARAWADAHPGVFEGSASHPPLVGRPPSPGRGPWSRPQAQGGQGGEEKKAEGPPSSSWEGPSHFVVLHDAVGKDWHKGDVVAVRAAPDGTDFERLFEVGAVRPANESEAGQGQVTIPDEPDPRRPQQGIEQATRDLREQVADLKQQLFEARDQARQLRNQPARPQQAPEPPDAGLIREKDEAIHQLTRRLEETEQARQQMAEQLAAYQQQAAGAEQQAEDDGGRRRRR